MLRTLIVYMRFWSAVFYY